jgi:signal transduction histidine kinase
MHDGLQQYLGAIAMRLELARGLSEQDPAEAARIAIGQQDVARRATDELRYMVRRLRAPDGEVGFLEVARQQTDLAQERCKGVVRLSSEGQQRQLAPKIEHAAVRILQEALNNCAKHADAASVTVSVMFGDDALRVAIEDDGKGIALASETSGDGFGLVTMAQRAHAVGGMLEVGPRKGGGTRVAFAVPYFPPLASGGPPTVTEAESATGTP